MDHNISLIVATDKFKGIAKDGVVPWYCSADLKYFRQTTIGEGNNAVIMGRKTYMSLPEKYRPLSQRTNIVLSSTMKQSDHSNIIIINDISHLWLYLADNEYDEIFVAGGEMIYNLFLTKYLTHFNKIYLTCLRQDYKCDQFFIHKPDDYTYTEIQSTGEYKRFLLIKKIDINH